MAARFVLFSPDPAERDRVGAILTGQSYRGEAIVLERVDSSQACRAAVVEERPTGLVLSALGAEDGSLDAAVSSQHQR